MKLLLYALTTACLPLRHLSLSSPYGYRLHPVTGRYSFHSGVDLRAHADTVFAVLPGRITAVRYDRLLGISIRYASGRFLITNGHLSQYFVLPGDTVSGGQPLGITGATGRVTGEHLHFTVQLDNRCIDPLQFLAAALKEF
jgi:murein DD-endopeptidase MepM/ murein hydrolase activator NlpD